MTSKMFLKKKKKEKVCLIPLQIIQTFLKKHSFTLMIEKLDLEKACSKLKTYM